MAVKQVAAIRIKEIREEIELEEIKDKPINGFTFVGIDSNSRQVKGNVPYTSAEEAIEKLEISGINVANLKPASTLFKRKRDKRPSVDEMAQLAEQFAAQKDIGLTYDRICQIIANRHPNLAMQRALNEVADRIKSGNPANEAFAAQLDKKGKPFFPATFINAFRIGDDVGALPDPETDVSADAPVVMLRFFAQAQRKAAALFKKIKSAMYYPAGIIGAVFIAFFVEVYFIVPVFAQIFVGLLQGKDTSLPLPTQLMLDISDFFRSPLGWGTTLAIFVGLGISIYYFFGTDKGIDKRERLVLKIPLIRNFYIPYYASIFCRNLSMMWGSESNLAKRFQTVGETSTNPVFREMCEHLDNQVRKGTAIGQLFNGYVYLLGDSFGTVAETIENAPGEGQKQLYTYAKYLEQEAEDQLDLAIAIMGKGSFLFAAGMVVFILIASYMPLLEMVGRMANR